MALMCRDRAVQHSIIAKIALTIALFGDLSQCLNWEERAIAFFGDLSQNPWAEGASAVIAPENKNQQERASGRIILPRTDKKNQAVLVATAESASKSFEEQLRAVLSMVRLFFAAFFAFAIVGFGSCLLIYGSIGAGVYAIFSSGGGGGGKDLKNRAMTATSSAILKV